MFGEMWSWPPNCNPIFVKKTELSRNLIDVQFHVRIHIFIMNPFFSTFVLSLFVLHSVYCECVVEFVSVPDHGVVGPLSGKIVGCDQISEIKVNLFIYVGSGWWTKPTYESSDIYPDPSDGRFTVDWITGGNDKGADILCLMVLPRDVPTVYASGQGALPNTTQFRIAELAFKPRGDLMISFSGRDLWIKKNSVDSKVGPGPNYFSKDDVEVNEDGYLVLHSRYHDSKWFSSEVTLVESLGYGLYMFVLENNIASIDDLNVFGLFTWDNDSPATKCPYREIDIEFSRWDYSNNNDTQFVVQPFGVEGNIHRFMSPKPSESNLLTAVFQWAEDSICWAVFEGNLAVKSQSFRALPLSSAVDSWCYTNPEYIPTPGNENVHLNFWNFNGDGPVTDHEVVLRHFSFTNSDMTSSATRASVFLIAFSVLLQFISIFA